MYTSISIVIPARNEEANLPKCLAAISEATQLLPPEIKIEVIVVINRCTDKTAEIAKLAGCTTVFEDAKNLSAIRNAGIKTAKHEIIITIDADSCMSNNALDSILRLMNTKQYVGGGVLILPERYSLGIILCFTLLLPFLWFWRISCGMFFADRHYVLEVNGFNEAMYSAEDLDFAKRLKTFGKNKKLKFKNFYSVYITTSCRKFDRFGDWYPWKNPKQMIKLLKGNKSEEADKIWYDF